MNWRKGVRLAAFACFAAVSACSQEAAKPPPAVDLEGMSPEARQAYIARAAKVDGPRIVAADSEPGNWLAHGRTYGETRYSPLDQINDRTVGKLGFAWAYDTDTVRGLEGTPLVADGVMYATGSWSKVYALDARTGKGLWTYDPKVPGEYGRKACCDVINRGPALWKGKLYVGTLDGRLIALDAATGKLAWEVDTVVDRTRPYSISGAPRIVRDKVVIGNSGADFGVRGYITAYDTATGRQAWRFWLVPGNPKDKPESPEMAMALETWSTDDPNRNWWEPGGGGTAWDSMAYDADLNLLYVGTGNGTPWNRWDRSPGGGDNLFLSSILAINPDTGRMVWYYQVVPGESWDYTATQHMILTDLTIGGKVRKVLMQAPKNGFFYVLDRATGELLSAKNFVPVTWARGIDMNTGRPIENTDKFYRDKPQWLLPSAAGAHNWHPMSYSPKTGLVYIPAQEEEFLYARDRHYKFGSTPWNAGQDWGLVVEEMKKQGVTFEQKMGRGMLIAWDPVAQKARWESPNVTMTNGGTLATAGNLVFQGTGDGTMRALNAETGSPLWSINVKTGMIAPPVTYMVNGEQYVAIMAGWGGGRAGQVHEDAVAYHTYGNDGRIVAFKLGGGKEVPGSAIVRPELPEPPPLTADAATIEEGGALYHQFCSVCHGMLAVGQSNVPDLRYSGQAVHEVFQDIVLGGMLKDRGMASFADHLKPGDVRAIEAYVVDQARKAWDAQLAKKSAAKPE